MIIKSIHIDSFGKHKNLDIETTHGLNIFYGPNEAGKSTIQAFIRAMLYGINSRSRSIIDNDRVKYCPWDGGPMGGEIIFQYKGVTYCLKRTFGSTRKLDEIALYNNVSGENVALMGQEPGEWIFHMTKETFENTVCIGQLSARIDSSKEKGSEMLAKLSNLTGTGDENLSISEIDLRLNKAMISLHSPRRDKGIADRLIQEVNSLKEELNKYYSIKASTTERNALIKNYLKMESELKGRLESLKNKRTILDNSKIVSDWERISALNNRKIALERELGEAIQSVTYSGVAYDKNMLFELRRLYQNYIDSLGILNTLKMNCDESYKNALEQKKQLSGKEALESINISEVQGINKEIEQLERAIPQQDILQDKIHSLEKEILDFYKSVDSAKSEMSGLPSGKTPVKTIPAALSIIIGLIIAASGFFIHPLLSGAGVLCIAAGLGFLFSHRRKISQHMLLLESEIKNKRDHIRKAEASLDVCKEQLDVLLRSNGISPDSGNLYDKLDDLKRSLTDIFASTGYSDIKALEHAVSDFKTLKIRYADALKNFSYHKAKFTAAQKRSNSLQEAFYGEFINIGYYTDHQTIVDIINALENQINKINDLKNKIFHTDELIHSALNGRNIGELKTSAESILSKSLDICDFSEDEYIEINKDIEILNNELINIQQAVFNEKSIISSAFKGIRSEAELIPLIENMTEQINEYEYNYSCLETARDVLKEAFEEMQQSFGPLINNKTMEIFNRTTGNKCDAVKVSRDFEISIKQENDIMLRSCDYLSSGTLDQIYFSLRMAIADLIADDGCKAPLFLDDAFVQYDDERVSRVMDYIAEVARERQIFIFTCHKRCLGQGTVLTPNPRHRTVPCLANQ